MPSDDNQRIVFDFFVEHLRSQTPFTREELEEKTTWQGKTFRTYWSKQFRPFVIEAGDGKYLVGDAFRRITTWRKFQQHVTQVRSLERPKYDEPKFDIVRIFEFFMPLTHENYLRSALDNLFFRETIEARLRTINSEELKSQFPQYENESDSDYLSRLCEWLSEKFLGYSIYHVSGRFRLRPLATRTEVASSTSQYLSDETTAVTRFIFPCETEDEASQVGFFFEHLFVKAIVDAVKDEDQIWMAETGMKNRIHIWRVTNS